MARAGFPPDCSRLDERVSRARVGRRTPLSLRSPLFPYLSLHRFAPAALLSIPPPVVCDRENSSDDYRERERTGETCTYGSRACFRHLSPDLHHPSIQHTSARPLRFVFSNRHIVSLLLSPSLVFAALSLLALSIYSSPAPHPPRSAPRFGVRPSVRSSFVFAWPSSSPLYR